MRERLDQFEAPEVMIEKEYLSIVENVFFSRKKDQILQVFSPGLQGS